MFRNAIAGIVVLLALSISGCSSLCDRAVSSTENFNAKLGSCSSAAGSLKPVNVSSCDLGLGKCSTDELKAINAYFDCIDKLPNCTAGQEQDFRNQKDNCKTSIVINDSCLASIYP